MKYSEYINSKEWKEKREFFRKILKNRCWVCWNVNFLVVHHKHYKTLGFERVKDVVLLCNDCHNKVHFVDGRKVELTAKALEISLNQLRYSKFWMRGKKNIKNFSYKKTKKKKKHSVKRKYKITKDPALKREVKHNLIKKNT